MEDFSASAIVIEAVSGVNNTGNSNEHFQLSSRTSNTFCESRRPSCAYHLRHYREALRRTIAAVNFEKSSSSKSIDYFASCILAKFKGMPTGM